MDIFKSETKTHKWVSNIYIYIYTYTKTGGEGKREHQEKRDETILSYVNRRLKTREQNQSILSCNTEMQSMNY